MKGDFSFLPFADGPHYTGVLQQQGRVLLDRDWNEAELIAARWRSAAGRDTFGAGVLAVPASNNTAFRVLAASVTGSTIQAQLDAGRGWVDGISLSLAAPSTYTASYFGAPFQSPQASAASIADGVRDLVVLDVWEDTVSAFQDPQNLLEPALGGPDTTERTQAFTAVKLLRLGPNDDCSAAAALADNLAARGHLTVSPAPVLMVTGDCPVDAGGGYTGLEHYLYRVEIADPDPSGAARFKWSRWNGGLVGRGQYVDKGGGNVTVNITANDQMINHCGVDSFYLEALAWNAGLGSWIVALTANATRLVDGVLSLSQIVGTWPSGATAFFRLWNGIETIAAFPKGVANPVELDQGIRLEFDAPAADNGNYLPGDWWTFPARAAGSEFPSPPWPVNASPRGLHHHRVALGILNWNAAPDTKISHADGDIDDCRRVFQPLTNQKICCTFNVGDGRSTHGDFDSIEEAIRSLPKSGGEICLLPGVHTTNAVIDGLRNVIIKGCDTKTRVIPRPETPLQPIFTVTASTNVHLVHMDLLTLGGVAIAVDGDEKTASIDIEIAHNRIIAFENAIHARQVNGGNIHHNRIRMIDKRGGGVAIYYSGNDGLIERNDIRLIPALQLPPIDPPDNPDPTDPGDPCAQLGPIYKLPRFIPIYIDKLWALPLLVLLKLSQPYKTQSGIQIGGGSERARVLENTVIGGAGNGVTLGSSLPGVTPSDTSNSTPPAIAVPRPAVIEGNVTGPDSKPVAQAQITLTDKDSGQSFTALSDVDGKFQVIVPKGNYTVTEDVSGNSIDKVDFQMPADGRIATLAVRLKPDAVPVPTDAGFLYRIAIERNRVEAMGLSGIGMAVDLAVDSLSSANVNATRALYINNAGLAARRQLATPVIGLAILGNHLVGNLLDLFDRSVLALAATQGLGGISLGLCEGVEIADNEIVRNGVSAANPACGIFIAYGEDVQIARNRIVNNGELTPDLVFEKLQPGERGGIVVKLASSFNLFDAQALANGIRSTARPALRIHENLVEQPVGHALRAILFGPLQCTDNAFASELSGLSSAEHLAGAVYLYDIGGVTQSGPGVALGRSDTVNETVAAGAAANTDRATAAGITTDRVGAAAVSTHQLAEAVFVQRDASAVQLLPSGDVMFSANQARTGSGNTSLSCETIVTFDDLAWQNNQSSALNTARPFCNGLLLGRTVRATGNRLRERNSETLISLLGIGTMAMDASLNQVDHCIVVTDMNPNSTEVKLGNQILNPSALCAGRSTIATNVFKPVTAAKPRK